MLWGNSNSILKEQLVNTGNLAYQVGMQNEESRLYGNYAIYDVVMQAAMGNAKVKKMINKEITEIINEGIEQALIDDYIKNLEAKQIFTNYSNQGINTQLGFAEYYYLDYQKYDARIEAYKKINQTDLKRIAQTYFNPETLKVINCKPLSE